MRVWKHSKLSQAKLAHSSIGKRRYFRENDKQRYRNLFSDFEGLQQHLSD